MERATSEKVGLAGLALGVVLLGVGTSLGLLYAPPEHYMGEVQRIMYIHVPTAWNAMLALTFSFTCAIGFVLSGRWRFDALLEAAIEVGVLFSFLLCMQGSIWARPTWGVWWDWDPRLTTTAVMMCSFIGILALRRFVEDPVRRATWSSISTIVAFFNVPLVYFSVKWWNSLHQLQSTPQTVDSAMVLPLRINAFGVLFLMIGFIALRARLASLRIASETAPPLPAPGGAA